ncbi:MAG TPA: hypothetical protein VGZ22_01035 [Isosphaeraceae bacterium]|jgi:hypothetical protein|nr:hypothetical protein [Isosphaeraceae bacterium]
MRRLIGFIALGVLALLFAHHVQISRLSHTCVTCRLTRVDATCFGFTHSTYYPNECSQWYAAHVEPAHAHVWERGTCEYTSNLLGKPLFVGCNPGHYPILLLEPSTQMRAYQHFKDPLEAKRLFESLTDEKTYNDRLDAEDDDRGELTVRAIQEWESHGFPGTWAEWWARFSTKHAEERKEWLTWMHSDSDMNFWDWQKQRKKGN